MCGRYRTPVGEAISPATWVEPVGSSPGHLSFRIFRAPTTSRCPSNEHCGQLKSLLLGLCLCPQFGHVCDVCASEARLGGLSAKLGLTGEHVLELRVCPLVQALVHPTAVADPLSDSCEIADYN